MGVEDPKVQAQMDEVSEIGNRLGIDVAFSRDIVSDGLHTADGRIYINPDAKNPLRQVLVHELTHEIESSGLYANLSAEILDYAQRVHGVELESMRRGIREDYSIIGQEIRTAEDADKEIVAKFAEQYLFRDEASINRLCNTNPNLFQRIRYWISDMLVKFRGTSEERFLRNAERLYARAWASRGEIQGAGISQNNIQQNMTDGQRYEILKNKNVELSAFVDYGKLKAAEEKLNFISSKTNFLPVNDRKKLFRKIGEEFGIFKEYQNKDIQLDFIFTKTNMKESLNKQKKNYENFAKMLTCFDSVIDSAVGIETHNRNEEGYKIDPTLKNVYVLVSAFEDNAEIIPVKLEVKEFSDKKNILYVAVALETIKKDEIITEGNTNNGVTQAAHSSNMSIAALLKKINSKDMNFLKYIPDEMLTQEQFKAKTDYKKYSFGKGYEEMRNAQNPGTEQTEATPSMKRADGGKTAEDWKSIAERINAEQGVWRMATKRGEVL